MGEESKASFHNLAWTVTERGAIWAVGLLFSQPGEQVVLAQCNRSGALAGPPNTVRRGDMSQGEGSLQNSPGSLDEARLACGGWINVTEKPGEYFSPSVVKTAERLHVFWIGQEGEEYLVYVRGYATREEAGSGSGRPVSLGAVHQEEAYPLDEGIPISESKERAYNLATCPDRGGGVWAFWEAWSGEGVSLKGRHWERETGWSESCTIPTGAARAYWPTLVAADDRLWIAWMSPNDSADGYDIMLASYQDGTWTAPVRVNETRGFHLYPSLGLDQAGRVWVTWSHDSPEDYYADLTSSVPYLQTPWARRKRNLWFKKFRVALQGTDGFRWWTLDSAGAGEVPLFDHALWPVISFDAWGRAVLLVRDYEAKSQLFRVQLAVATGDGWQVVPLEGGGSILLAPARVAFLEDLLLLAWVSNPDGLGEESQPEFRVLRISDWPGSAMRPEAVSGQPARLNSQPVRESAREREQSDDEANDPAFPREGEDLGADALSSPLLPATSKPGEGSAVASRSQVVPLPVLFGNIHIHTEISKCRRPTSHSLDLNYRWCMDCMGQEFASLTDHAETKTAYQWWLNRKTARFYNTDTFVTLLGYEWTFNLRDRQVRHHGHVNVYLRGESEQYWGARAEGSNSLEKLWSLLPAGEALTIPHHPAAYPFQRNWDWHDPEREPVVEIHQDRRGSFEYRGCPGGTVLSAEQLLDGCFVQDALARGHRLGFVSGGDHQGLSLTAVLAAGCSREDIFAALKLRRCYATTGGRILLFFAIEGAPMGAEVHLGDHGIEGLVQVRGTDVLESVIIIKNNQDWLVKDLRNLSTWEARVSFADAEARRGDFYYVRVVQRDGELAWGSPIWIK